MKEISHHIQRLEINTVEFNETYIFLTVL